MKFLERPLIQGLQNYLSLDQAGMTGRINVAEANLSLGYFNRQGSTIDGPSAENV